MYNSNSNDSQIIRELSINVSAGGAVAKAQEALADLASGGLATAALRRLRGLAQRVFAQ